MAQRKTTTAIIALTLVSAACAAPAFAAELGFYMVGAYGEARRGDVEQGPFDAAANSIYTDLSLVQTQSTAALGDDKDSAFAILGGYRLLPNLAIEGGYVDLGEISYRNDTAGTFLDQPEQWMQKHTVSTSGFTISVLGILPLSYRWELYARAGLLLASNELDVYITDFIGAGSANFNDSAAELLGGVGLSFAFVEVYGARIEYQRAFGVGGFEGIGEGDIDFVSLGLTVAF